VTRCSAPWYELNISAPDNIVSACCYYAGDKDPWLDEPADIKAYWNSRAFQQVRRINGLTPPEGSNGCSSCFYFQNRTEGAQYFDFDDAMSQADLSDAQRTNLARARDDFAGGLVEVTSTPLRIYANFGFACNLSCTMCHQVPRRNENRRQVSANSLLAWREALESAVDVTVIGGEPFALPEAIKFIRSFIADPAYDAVRLTICTNGTVHHKHMDTLRRKRKLSMAISLDSIGEGYERIRVNGKWDLVERNILEFIETQRKERPEWSLQTNALVQKTGIPLLPRFAAWHAKHRIITSFYDFINSRGTEDACYSENVLNNPHILDDMPGWEEYFHEAVEIFRKAGLTVAADTLDLYRGRVAAAVAAYRPAAQGHDRISRANAWEPLVTLTGLRDLSEQLVYSPGSSSGPSRLGEIDGTLGFTRTRDGDHVATEFVGLDVTSDLGALRARCHWNNLGARRMAHLWFQREDGSELVTKRDFKNGRDGGIDRILTCRLAQGSHRVRLVGMPVGEGESLLPDIIEIELIGIARRAEVAETPVADAIPFDTGDIQVETDARMQISALARAMRAVRRSVLGLLPPR
jgi:hypothetical protein